MPAKNSRKEYLENGYYHLYNRGVEKRQIFVDLQDYNVFLNYLKIYLLPKNITQLENIILSSSSDLKEKDTARKLLRLNNFSEEITLLAYCLMPNHFHFFVKQKSAGAIDQFLNSLGTRYTMYFNRKYARVGPLYQGVYKATRITTDEQFIYLTKYLHKQALVLQGHALQEQPSSYLEYVSKRKSDWVHPEEVLTYFSKSNSALSYQSFVLESEDLSVINDIMID